MNKWYWAISGVNINYQYTHIYIHTRYICINRSGWLNQYECCLTFQAGGCGFEPWQIPSNDLQYCISTDSSAQNNYDRAMAELLNVTIMWLSGYWVMVPAISFSSSNGSAQCNHYECAVTSWYPSCCEHACCYNVRLQQGHIQYIYIYIYIWSDVPAKYLLLSCCGLTS